MPRIHAGPIHHLLTRAQALHKADVCTVGLPSPLDLGSEVAITLPLKLWQISQHEPAELTRILSGLTTPPFFTVIMA